MSVMVVTDKLPFKVRNCLHSTADGDETKLEVVQPHLGPD